MYAVKQPKYNSKPIKILECLANHTQESMVE